jgi:hypothetical protein
MGINAALWLRNQSYGKYRRGLVKKDLTAPRKKKLGAWRAPRGLERLTGLNVL